MSSHKSEMVALRLTEAQKETWDARDDSAELVRDLLDDLADEDGNSSSSVAQFVRELADMDNRWSVPRVGDAPAVRSARSCGVDLPDDGQEAARELFAAVKASDVPVKEDFEVSESRISSVRAALK